MNTLRYFFFTFFILIKIVVLAQSPEELYKELFKEVQMKEVFSDSKTFPDCIPLNTPEEILTTYKSQKNKDDFNLKAFVKNHFLIPANLDQEFKSDTSLSIQAHIESLWPKLIRKPDTILGSSLIPLPHPYIVPGGRFREIYYWDSYFTMLGLQHAKHKDLIKNMADNFSFLIDQNGYIPNGNRTYYLSRSQPPYYSLIIQLLAENNKTETLSNYLPYLEKEYKFWMTGIDSLNKGRISYKRVVKISNKVILNRYWDDKPLPRPESYKEDVNLLHLSLRDSSDLFRNIRAACESGWDFSSRWFEDENNLSTIQTTEIIPVDLNCLLYHLELTIAEAYQFSENIPLAKYYYRLAKKRKCSILKYCWSKKNKFFMDYDYHKKTSAPTKSIAGVYPLYFNLAPSKKAACVKQEIMKNFLQKGGLVTTLNNTHEQWDWPNGWAPLQLMAVKSFINYGYKKEALEIAGRWIRLNTEVYKKTGKMLEKYNVVTPTIIGGGGEYPLQDGFGWTNGVYIQLIETFPDLK
jgi:alpha,alpha-trehalase